MEDLRDITSDKSDSEGSDKKKRKVRKSKHVTERNIELDKTTENAVGSAGSTSEEEDNPREPKRKAKKARIEELIARKVREVLSQQLQTTTAAANILPAQTSTSTGIIKNDIIPVFDPETGEATSTNWLNKIDQLGLIHNWSDETKSYYMQSKLAGIARLWYNGLKDYNKTWVEWRRSLLDAFPSHEHFVDNLKRMMERKKKPNESMMHYYYAKCVLIRKCDISDTNAVSCIIDGLPVDHQGTAKSANFKTPEDLFKGFLCKMDSDSSSSKPTFNNKREEQKCNICKKPGHLPRHCYFRRATPEESNPRARVSEYRNREGQLCSHCGRNGHSKETCWHLNSAKVHLLQRQVNKLYNLKVSLNNVCCKGYLDTGSQLNVAHLSLVNRLKNISLKTSDVVLKGIGGEIIFPRGMSPVKFQFKTFSIVSNLHFIDADMGDIEVIIGQPILNHKDISIKIQRGIVQIDKISDPHSYPVNINDTVTIDPLCTAAVPVLINQGHTHKCLLLSAKTYHFKEHYSIMSHILLNPENIVNVTNIGKNKLCLLKGRVLARAIEIDPFPFVVDYENKDCRQNMQVFSLNVADVKVN